MSDVEMAIAGLLRQGVTLFSGPEDRILGSRILTFRNGAQYRLSDAEVEDLAQKGKLSVEGIAELKSPMDDNE